jgi:hypothetical protein
VVKKFLVLLMLTPLLAGAASGQTAAATTQPHGVTVIGGRWDSAVYNPALLEDPMDVSTDAAQLQREQRQVARENRMRERTGRTPLPPRTEPRIKTAKRSSGGATTVYVYQVRVSNDGTKKIRSIVWDYVLFDAATRREVGHNEFESRVGIGVGKRKDLVGSSTTPPATVVDVSKSDKVVRGQYAERVDIKRVEYDDGTVWESGPDK